MLITCEIATIGVREKSASVKGLFVVPECLYTCISGETLRSIGVKVEKRIACKARKSEEPTMRAVGYVILRAHGFETVDEVIFGEPGDQPLLGSRTLAGFGAKVVRGKNRLAAIGPAFVPGNRQEDWR